MHSSSGSAELTCRLTEESKQKWQQQTFKAIIDAYEETLEDYNNKVAEEKAKALEIKGTNPGFYRQIENMILRKNCISYLISSNPKDLKTFGQNFYTQNNTDTTLNFGNAKSIKRQIWINIQRL